MNLAEIQHQDASSPKLPQYASSQSVSKIKDKINIAKANWLRCSNTEPRQESKPYQCQFNDRCLQFAMLNRFHLAPPNFIFFRLSLSSRCLCLMKIPLSPPLRISCGPHITAYWISLSSRRCLSAKWPVVWILYPIRKFSLYGRNAYFLVLMKRSLYLSSFLFGIFLHPSLGLAVTIQLASAAVCGQDPIHEADRSGQMKVQKQ